MMIAKKVMAGLGATVAVLGAGGVSVGSSASADVPRAQQAALAPGFMIASNMNNLCLDIRASNAGFGAYVDMDSCNGFVNQRWQFSGVELVTDLNSSAKCLDVNNGNTGPGAGINTWGCHGGGPQQWQFVGPQLVNIASNRCLTIADANSGTGAAVVLENCVAAINQQWHRVP
jgi:ricin-type beta-trefoil lectin protein